MKNEIYIISIIIFICYHKSLHHQFVFDDNFAIVKNKDIHQCNIYNIFSHDYWGMEINNILSNKSYRPLTTLTFCFNYWYGGLNPFYFHFTNVILHIIVCLIMSNFITSTIIIISKKKKQLYDIKENSTMSSIGVVVALLYGLHPANVESVCNIVGRAEILSLFFTLICLFIVSKMHDQQNNNHDNKDTYCYYHYMLFIIIISTFAYFSKETGLLSLPISLLYSTLCFENFTWKRFKYESLILLPPFLFHIVIRYYLLNGNVSPNFTYVDNPLFFEKDIYKKFILTLNVHWEYIRLIIYPNTLSCDYGPSSLPTTNKDICQKNQVISYFINYFNNNINNNNNNIINDVPVLGSCTIVQASILYGFLLTIFFISIYNYIYHKNGIKLFAFLWFVILIYPASHLGMKIGTVLAERLLYTPIVAVLLWIFSSFTYYYDIDDDESITNMEKVVLLDNNKKNKKKSTDNILIVNDATKEIHYSMFYNLICNVVWKTIISGIIIIFAIHSMNRIDKWKNNLTLFKSALETYPNNARMNNNVGTTILRNSVKSSTMTKDLQLAQMHFHRALTSAPSHTMAWHNYGLTLLMLKKPSDSLPYFENAIKLEPNVEMILNNYGIALRDAGEKTKANQIFKRAEKLGRFNQVKRPGFDG